MSDTSSDECDERLREAAVTANDIVKKRPPKSVPETGDAFKNEGTNITDLSAECRNFLAKSLSNSLDKQIKVVSRETETQDHECDTGIRLFTDSTVQVVDIEEPQVQQRRKKHKKSREKVTDDMLAAVAVTPEWVLGQSGIKKS